MLKVSEKNVIVGYVPCLVCQTPSVVHFPSGGKRENTPYLCCGKCKKTIQTKEAKEHIVKHHVPTLSAYSSKYGVDVNDEIEQVKINKWVENASLFDAKINGINDAEESFEVTAFTTDDLQPERETETELDTPVTIDNDTQEVIDQSKPKGKANKPKPEQEADEDENKAPSGGALVLVVFLVVLSLGGYFLIKYLKGKPSDDEDDADE
ncbi:hypothetical protein RJD39_15655 [Vibrio scophthalmi]|uniref:hypothetical protein n=1 Tax=Vibrio scophthalmi TaxID=45658 RepID=UPI003872DD19